MATHCKAPMPRSLSCALNGWLAMKLQERCQIDKLARVEAAFVSNSYSWEGASDLLPDDKGVRHDGSVFGGEDEMATKLEVRLNAAMGG